MLAFTIMKIQCGRDQAVTKDGQKRYDVVFPKFKKGGHTVRGIKTRCTYGMSVNLIKNKINKTSVNMHLPVACPGSVVLSGYSGFLHD